MATSTQLAAAGGLGLLGLIALDRQGEPANLEGVRSAFQQELDALRAAVEERTDEGDTQEESQPVSAEDIDLSGVVEESSPGGSSGGTPDPDYSTSSDPVYSGGSSSQEEQVARAISTITSEDSAGGTSVTEREEQTTSLTTNEEWAGYY